MKELKKRGRPSKPKSQRAVSVNFTMRLRPTMMEDLRRTAEANDRTISAEAERRLQHPEPDMNDLGRLVALAIEGVQLRAGKRWSDDPDVMARCRTAADHVLDLILGPPMDVAELLASLKAEIQPGIFDQLLGRKVATPDEVERALSLADGILDDRAAIADQMRTKASAS